MSDKVEKSLKDIIDSATPVDKDYIFDITEKLLEILLKLSKEKPPLIHGNITPSNIIIKDDGSLELINFNSERKKPFLLPKKEIKLTIQSDLYLLGLTLVNLTTKKDISELLVLDNKVQFRRDTGIDRYYKNLLDDLIHPNPKFRIKNPKKALKHLLKVKKGKFGLDPFARR